MLISGFDSKLELHTLLGARIIPANYYLVKNATWDSSISANDFAGDSLPSLSNTGSDWVSWTFRTYFDISLVSSLTINFTCVIKYGSSTLNLSSYRLGGYQTIYSSSNSFTGGTRDLVIPIGDWKKFGNYIMLNASYRSLNSTESITINSMLFS